MKKKLLLLINASSGTGTGREKTYEIIESLSLNDCICTVLPIIPKNPKINIESMPIPLSDYDIITACGGDGTISHLINILMKYEKRPSIAYIPCGSTNDFAKSMGIPQDLNTNCMAIANGQDFAYDIASFGEKYFNYVAACGAFTSVSYSTNQNLKNLIGYPAYMLKSLVSLHEISNKRFHMRIEHDGEVDEDDYIFLSVSNSNSLAGFNAKLKLNAKLNDGLFEIIAIKAPKHIYDIGDIINDIITIKEDSPYIKSFKCRKIKLSSEKEIDWTIDGEYGGSHKNIDIEVIPKAIKIRLPKLSELKGV